MALAFRKIWGNFVTTNNPSISTEEANGASSNSTSANDASAWIPYSADKPYQLNLNQVRPSYIANDHTIPATQPKPIILSYLTVTQTGGTPMTYTVWVGPGLDLAVNGNPGLQNDISLVDAGTWEGGRGLRCEFWRSVGPIVPE